MGIIDANAEYISVCLNTAACDCTMYNVFWDWCHDRDLDAYKIWIPDVTSCNVFGRQALS